jgi:alpha-beta hydrolase superfamily lysophospholipase
MAAIDVPMLVMSGEEDELCLEPSLLIKRVVSKVGLSVLPKAGHAVNLEEPQVFNQMLDHFLHQVAEGKWGPRDPRAKLDSIWGPGGKPTSA